MKDKERQKKVSQYLNEARKKFSGIQPGFPKKQASYYSEAFGFCWKAFDQYTASEYPVNFLQKRIEQFINDFEKGYSLLYFSDNWNNRFKALKIFEIGDGRPHPNSKNNPLKLTTETDLEELINFVYAVRCNLDHGSILPEQNVDLIRLTFFVFFEVLDKLLRNKC